MAATPVSGEDKECAEETGKDETARDGANPAAPGEAKRHDDDAEHGERGSAAGGDSMATATARVASVALLRAPPTAARRVSQS
jgi:hypothetical protein